MFEKKRGCRKFGEVDLQTFCCPNHPAKGTSLPTSIAMKFAGGKRPSKWPPPSISMATAPSRWNGHTSPCDDHGPNKGRHWQSKPSELTRSAESQASSAQLDPKGPSLGGKDRFKSPDQEPGARACFCPRGGAWKPQNFDGESMDRAQLVVSAPLIGSLQAVVWWLGGGFPFTRYKNQRFKFKSEPPIQTITESDITRGWFPFGNVDPILTPISFIGECSKSDDSH